MVVTFFPDVSIIQQKSWCHLELLHTQWHVYSFMPFTLYNSLHMMEKPVRCVMSSLRCEGLDTVQGTTFSCISWCICTCTIMHDKTVLFLGLTVAMAYVTLVKVAIAHTHLFCCPVAAASREHLTSVWQTWSLPRGDSEETFGTHSYWPKLGSKFEQMTGTRMTETE